MVSYLRFSQALDGTPWALSLHGNQWFRPYQYTGQDEISTWILKSDEKYFADFTSVNGVIRLPYSEAKKIFANSMAMFAFRLSYGLANHAHIASAKVLLSFMARLCCDLHALKQRQAGYQVNKGSADAFVWPDNGPFEVDPTLATRVVITEVTLVALIPLSHELGTGGVVADDDTYTSDASSTDTADSEGFPRPVIQSHRGVSKHESVRGKLRSRKSNRKTPTLFLP